MRNTLNTLDIIVILHTTSAVADEPVRFRS